MDVPHTVEKIVDGNSAFQEDEPFNLQQTEASITIDESGVCCCVFVRFGLRIFIWKHFKFF